MKFRQVILICGSHLAWQMYGLIHGLRGPSVTLAIFGMLIGFVTYFVYEAEFAKEKTNDETEA